MPHCARNTCTTLHTQCVRIVGASPPQIQDKGYRGEPKVGGSKIAQSRLFLPWVPDRLLNYKWR